MAERPHAEEGTPKPGTDSKHWLQFVGFELDRQKYAFRIEQIQEIVILDQVTPTPQVATCVEGVTNLRGEIIPVVSLRKLMGMSPRPSDGETRTIVVNVSGRRIGCTVDAVSQVIRIPEESIQPSLDTLTADGNRDVAGFAKLGEDFFIVLDIDELFQPNRLKRVSPVNGL